MKKFLHCFIVLIVLTFACESSRASHIAGADLTYKWISGNEYEITMTLYRDCFGISVANPETIHFISASSGLDFTTSINLIPGTGQEITPTSQLTTCAGGTYYGIQQYIYMDTVTLPPANDWVISWCSCCRNAAITTVSSPDMDGTFIMATLDNSVSGTQGGNPNSSPTFSNIPITIFCDNQQVTYNHGAIETDGDSLAYEFITPYDQGPAQYSSSCSGGGGTNVVYSSPWTYSQPLTSAPALTIDSITGDINMTPTQDLITIMAVLVKEYRNGILIGSVMRDLQMNIISCTNVVPRLSGIDSTANYITTTAPGIPIDFDIFSYDSDGGNVLTMSWNSGIPGAIFSVASKGSRPTGHFTWTPTTADVRNFPHCFTVKIEDNATPYFGLEIHSYCLYVSTILGQQDFSSEKVFDFKLIPNPFTENTSIQYTLTESSKLTIELIDNLGKHVSTLLDETQLPSTNTINLDSKKLGITKGIYFVRMKLNGETVVKRLVAL
jgi:hypothetical protein